LGLTNNALQGPSGEDRAAWQGHFGETIMDVREALRISEGDNRCANDDALGDLSQRILLELLLEFGLPDQHDLDKLFCGDFQVREQPELFEGRERHKLGFIDDNRNITALTVFLKKELMEFGNHFKEIL